MPEKPPISFDTWRQDLVYPDYVKKDVLFLRARRGDVEFFTPVYEEELIKDAQQLLVREIERFEDEQNEE